VAESTISEEIAMALGVALVRKGILDSDDLARVADDAQRGGQVDAAHALRVIAIEGQATPQSDWEAGRRRAQMRLVKPSDAT
jgi:hypothetical protein